MFMEELENVIREKDIPLPSEIPNIEELKGPSSDEETSSDEDSYDANDVPPQTIEESDRTNDEQWLF